MVVNKIKEIVVNIFEGNRRDIFEKFVVIVMISKFIKCNIEFFIKSEVFFFGYIIGSSRVGVLIFCFFY